MVYTKSILIGVVVYLSMIYGEKSIHFIYFYSTHNFGTNNLLLIKSSFILHFAPILGGFIAGYFSKRGLITGFMVGLISGLLVLLSQSMTGANPFNQEFTPSILFDEVFLKACVTAISRATGELIQLKKTH